MSSEVQTLVIQVKSDQVKEGDKNLDHLAVSAHKAEKATDLLKEAFTELIGPLLGIAGAVKGFEKLVEVTKEFQSLEAQLKTVTGSAESAKEVFEVLRELAASTPFELKDMTDAFTTLVNKGLDPSTAALKAYGNIATATNQSITGVVDAVSRAALGQYRGLIELGVKAIEVEDGIVLSFHGTTTKIAKDSKAIQDYIQNLGNTQFAGAMENQERTLTGAIHNLKDAWDELFYSISQGGFGEIIQKGVELATRAVRELTAEISSGQLLGYIKAVSIAFTGWVDDAADAIHAVQDIINAGAADIKEQGFDIAQFLKDAFFHFPENVRAAMQLFGIVEGTAFLAVENAVRHAAMAFAATFQLLIELSKDAGKALVSNLNPFDGSAQGTVIDFTMKAKDAVDKWKESVVNAKDDFVVTAQFQAQAARDGITDTLDQRDATIKSAAAQVTAADKVRAAWDAAQKAKHDAQEVKDPLAKFKPTGPTKIVTPEDIAAFEALKKSLQLEEDTIQQSYNRRLKLIRDNTIAGSKEQLELTKELENRTTLEYEKAAQDRFDKVKSLDDELNQAIADGDYSRVDNLMFTLNLEEEEIKKSYDRRKQQIMSDEKLTAQQRLDLVTKLENEYTQRQKELEIRRTSQVLTASSQLFQSLADIAADAAGKQSTLYKVMFAASKAFAIADALVKIQQGIANAFVLPWPANLAAAASVAAATAGIIANISSVAGVFDTGGMIPAGKFGIAGEKGAELIQGPAVVTSTRSTADRRGQGDGPQVIVNIQNHTDAQATVQETETSDGKVIEVIIKRVENSLSGGIKSGGTPLSRSIESTYGLRRGAT